MIFKIFAGFAFLLMALECFDAETLPHLDCGTESPTVCKEKFKNEYEKLYLSALKKYFEKLGEGWLVITRKSFPLDPKIEDAEREYNEWKHEVQNSSDVQEVLDRLKILKIFVKYFNYGKTIDELVEKRYELKSKMVLEVVPSVMQLFADLRPQDFEEFKELRYYENQLKYIIENPERANDNNLYALETYLGFQWRRI